MADLTVDNSIRLGPGAHHIREWVLDNKTAQTVYKGQPMILLASSDTLYVRGYIAATVLTTTDDKFIGINASAQKSARTTDNETANTVDIIMSGIVGLPNAALTDADIGKTASMTGSATVVAAAGGAANCEIGRIMYVEDGYVYVKINAAGGGAPILCA
jgi:predicted RecA/RadA family phage recombinase